MVAKKKSTNRECDIKRLQDVYFHNVDPDGYEFRTPGGRQMREGSKTYNKRLVSLSREALKAACVPIPRSAKTPSALLRLAKAAAVSAGVDIETGRRLVK